MKPCSYCGRDNADDAAHCRECGTEFERHVDPEPIQPIGPPESTGPEYKFAPLSAADAKKDLVTVVSCRTLVAADLVVSRLQAAGIEAFLPDQYLMQAVGWNFNTYGYVRVQIAPTDYDAARNLLSEIHEDAT